MLDWTYNAAVPANSRGPRFSMARFEQYEVWEFNHGRWEMVASFRDFDLANVMARRRSYRARLVRVTYEDGKALQQEVLSEIGATREKP